jgi:acyl-CoA dehydrogenase
MNDTHPTMSADTTPPTGASELEVMIGDTVRRLFTDQVDAALRRRAEAGEWLQALWTMAEDAGLPLALCSASRGGSEARWVDAWPIFAGIGRWAVPLPLAETMVAAWVLDHAGQDLPAGPITIAAGGAALSLDGGALSGTLHDVPWAGPSRWLLTTAQPAARGAALGVLVDLQAPSARCTPGRSMAGEPRAAVQFTRTVAAAAFAMPSKDGADPLLTLGALARSAMLVGAMEAALASAVEHANEREQFGRPLARFQAIQHALAAAAAELVAARVAARVAFASMGPNGPGPTTAFDVAVAKARAGQAASRVAALAHQVHGAIGFTQEHALHQATRRLWAWRQEFGSDAQWAARLGRHAIAHGAAGFWSALCERRLDVEAQTTLEHGGRRTAPRNTC